MSAEAAIYAQLSGDAGVTALVGARIYAQRLPQRPTLPALSYTSISKIRPQAMGVATGLSETRVQVDAWATDYATVRGLADAVRAALERARGSIGGVTVQDILPENEGDALDDEGTRYRVSLDWRVWHED